MNSDQIFDLLCTINANAGKLEKERMLREADCPELRRVLTAALDPLTTYGIAKLPVRDATMMGDQLFAEPVWTVIDWMQDRKLTGSEMQVAVAEMTNALSAKSAALLGRILTKDLKAGFGENTVNKAIPGLIREFPYMRCSLPKGDKLDKLDWAGGIISQEKADGMFLNINHVTGGQVMLFSRSGTLFPNEAFGNLITMIRNTFPEDTQLHGEMLVQRKGMVLPREEGNGILNGIAQGGTFEIGDQPTLMLWDMVPLNEVKPKAKYKVGYADRLRRLLTFLKDVVNTQLTLIPSRVVKSKEEAYLHYRDMLAQGKEGTILKLPQAIWRDGTSTEQFKLKLEADVDLKMVALNPGEGKNAATFGSVLCVSDCGALEVNVSGFKDAQRLEIARNWEENYLGMIMTVRGNAIMKPSNSNDRYSLFLPRCVEIRTDKDVADDLARIIDQFGSAVRAA